MKENKKFTIEFTQNVSEVAVSKLVCHGKRNFPNIATDTVAHTETANKFSQSLKGLIHRCTI